MNLAVDIGNTNISIGSFQGKKLISHYYVNNKSLANQKAAFPLSSFLLNQTRNILVASVNPKTESVFYKYLGKKHKKKVLKIGKEIKLKMPILVDNPQKVGVDRLLNALAAYSRTKTLTIIIDFGTAITIDIVSKNGEFLGGLILPGIKTSAYALNKQTALLPEVVIKRTKNIIGKNTEDAIKAGIYFGMVGSITHILNKVRKVYGDLQYTIATGGDAETFRKDVPKIDKVIPRLTLEGIRIAFKESLNP